MVTIAPQLEQKGIEKGMLQGEHKSRVEIAEKLLKSSMARDSVKEMTGLLEEEFAKISY
jgi:predicted transposase/invertase (TIGR01784 family)